MALNADLSVIGLPNYAWSEADKGSFGSNNVLSTSKKG